MQHLPAALPFVDAHARRLAVPPARAWDALARTLARSFRGRAAERYARLVGSDPAEITGAFPSVGSTIAGFRITAADAPRLLVLAGRHRFATYELVFRLDAEDAGRATRLVAETRAEFHGVAGRVYRAAVIGTGGHGVAVRRLLAKVGREGERG